MEKSKKGFLSPDELRVLGYELRREKNEKGGFASWIVKEKQACDYLVKNLPKGERVLDIGCGSGEFMMEMKNLGYNVYGNDIVCYLRFDELKDKFKAIDASMETYPYPDGYFGAVTLLEAMDHVENPYHVFREAHRLLKPKGIFICSSSNAFNIYNKVRFFIKGDLYQWRKGSNHVSPLTKGILEKTLFNLFILKKKEFDRGYVPYFHFIHKRLSKILPRSEIFSNHIAFFLEKKES